MNAIAAFLKKWTPVLTPPWLPAANAHWCFAYFVIFTVAVKWPGALWAVVVLGVLLAGVKEFYIDKHFETTPQTFAMNLTDFATYMLGIVLALVIHAL